MQIEVGILSQGFDRIGRKAGRQGRHVDPAGPQLGLHGVGIANHADAQRLNMRRAVVIVRVGFEIYDLLGRIVAFEFERPGAERMRFLRFITVLGNHGTRHQVRQ